MLSKRVISLAQKVRQEVEIWTYGNRDVDNQTLCGACAVASYAIYKVLKANGYKPKFILGIDWKRTRSHAWVEIGGYVLDLTATQFSYKSKVFIIKKRHYKLCREFTDTSKQAYALARLKSWPASPFMYMKEINNLVKALTPTKAYDKVMEC